MNTKRTFLFVLGLLILTALIGETSGDNVAPSTNPPKGLSAKKVPQFVNWGIDDGYGTDGLKFILSYFKNKKNPVGPNNNPLTFDGTPARISFYMNSSNLFNDSLFKVLVADGHELGNHTANHFNCGTATDLGDEYPPLNYDVQGWLKEMNTCTDSFVLVLGIPKSEVVGFRVPFLSYNQNCFKAIAQNNLIYDCTLHGGSENSSGASYNWPYTLDNSSPGEESSVGKHAGVWEVPTHYVVTSSGQKVTGLDYNMIEKKSWNGLEMNKSQYLGALKNTFNLRYDGNRAPMTFGAHCHYYGIQPDDTCPKITLKERQEVLTEFFDYVLSKPDVRVVPSKKIIDWMRNPVSLDQTPVLNNVKKTINKISLKQKSTNTIEVTVPSNGFYHCRLYSTSGKLVRTLIHANLTPGAYTFALYSFELPSGTYFVKLDCGKKSSVITFATL